ncbi:MAG: HAD family hydrolase, partial [Candidatus Aenigmatarchaeota archaeon]
MIEAVLFDFDSLIVAGREEDMFIEALEDIREGLSLKFFEFCVEDYEWYGFCSPEEVLERFFEWETFEPEARMKQFHEILDEIKENVEVKKQIEDVAEILEDEGISVGVVMNSEGEELLLHNLGIIDLFDYVFVGERMKVEKPFEDFYKKVCEIMDLKPFQVLLVEDFMNDIAP